MRFFAIKYRRRPASPSDLREPPKSGHKHGALALEITWTVIPLIMVAFMFLAGARVFVRSQQPPLDAMAFSVIGKQWMWQAQHPTGAREINALHVPAGKPIRLLMISEDVIHDFGLQCNGSGIRYERSVIVHRAAGQGDVHAHPASVRAFAQQDGLSRRDADAAVGRGDHAVVFNTIGDKKHGAVLADADLSIVDDGRERRRAVEFPRAPGILRRQAIRGGHNEAGGLNKRIRPEIKTILVHQHDQTVGLQGAINLRCVGVVDVIHDQRMRRWLVENGRLTGADVEALPIEHGTVSGRDGQLRTARMRGGRAGGDGHSRRIGHGLQGDADCKKNCDVSRCAHFKLKFYVNRMQCCVTNW